MGFKDKIALIESIGREFERRDLSRTEAWTLLARFSVFAPAGTPSDDRRLYAKIALAGVSDEIVLRIAYELGLEFPDITGDFSFALPSEETGKMRNDSHRLIELRDLVCKHFSESDWHELGLLTDSDDIVMNHPRLLRSLRFGDDDYKDNILPVLMSINRRGKNNFAIMDSLVSKRAVSVEENGTVFSGKVITFQPKVFEIPDAEVDPLLVSVMMPFSANLTSVYSSIQGAAEEVGFRCQRADDIWDHSVVIQDVFSLIYRSFVVVCDFTGKNANVFYEAGIAHTLGKHVVPITQSVEDIPFDVRHHRLLFYHGNVEGISDLRKGLVQRFQTLNNQR